MSVVVEQVHGRRLKVVAGGYETFVDGSSTAAGEAFRSVDLLLGSLGSCMVGTMLSAAQEKGLDVSNVRVELRPLVALTPERVTRIRMTMSLDGDLTAAHLEVLRTAAESCKVHNSLHAGIQTSLELIHTQAKAS